MEPFEKSGLWWLSTNSNHVLGGVLSFSTENGLSLRLMGNLTEDHFPNMSKIRYDIIFGATDDGKKVTLYYLSSSGSGFSTNGFAYEEYKAQFGFIGYHFLDKEVTSFRSAQVRFTYLLEWIDTDLITLEKESSQRLSATYNKMEDTHIESEIGSISLSSSVVYNTGKSRYLLRPYVFFNLDANKEHDIFSLLNTFVSPLQDLISLATARPSMIDRMFVKVPDKEGQLQSIEVFFERKFQEASDKKINIRDMLFTLREIDSVSDIINRWLIIDRELNDFGNLFFSSQYAPSAYIESRFLITVQAAEIYHRSRYSNAVMDLNLHKQMVKSIIDSSPEEYKDWLIEKLQHTNEPRLYDRLLELLDLCWDVLEPLVIDRISFARQVKDVRNYYTHYSKHLAKKIPGSTDVYWITLVVVLMIQRCYLHELGFSSEKSKVLFERNSQYSFVKNSINRSWIK